jgi:hypothetical protein
MDSREKRGRRNQEVEIKDAVVLNQKRGRNGFLPPERIPPGLTF